MAIFNLRRFDPAGIVVVIIIVVTVICALMAEYRDVRCTSFGSKQCGKGMGSAYADGRPESNDSIETLLKKIRITARYEVNSISWRRCFIAAVISAFLVLYIAKKKLPTGLQMGFALIVIYLIFYLMTGFFQKTTTQPALSQLDDILHLLNKRHSK